MKLTNSKIFSDYGTLLSCLRVISPCLKFEHDGMKNAGVISAQTARDKVILFSREDIDENILKK